VPVHGRLRPREPSAHEPGGMFLDLDGIVRSPACPYPNRWVAGFRSRSDLFGETDLTWTATSVSRRLEEHLKSMTVMTIRSNS